jgi:hypothetical protein
MFELYIIKLAFIVDSYLRYDVSCMLIRTKEGVGRVSHSRVMFHSGCFASVETDTSVRYVYMGRWCEYTAGALDRVV